MLSLKKAEITEEDPLLQLSVGQTGPWQHSVIKWHHRGWIQSGFPLSHKNLANHKAGGCSAVPGRRAGHGLSGDEGENSAKSLQDGSEIDSSLGASA